MHEWEYTAGGKSKPGESDAEFEARIERTAKICATSLNKVSGAYGVEARPLSDEFVRASALRLVECLKATGIAVPDSDNPQLAAAMAMRELRQNTPAGGLTPQLQAVHACLPDPIARISRSSD